jgi:RNA 2',3'-cyclic 3'-phosphodiesterase
MPRLFIGIKCNQQDYLKARQLELKRILSKSHISWVDPDNFHITLKFIGEVDEFYINSMQFILGNISRLFKPLALEAQKIGCFGPAAQPKVIWFGYKDEPRLTQLQLTIDEELFSLGIKKEEKIFKPHLTLGRIKRIVETEDLNEYIKNQKPIRGEKFQMNAFQLFQSSLTQNGPHYSILQEFRLATHT